MSGWSEFAAEDCHKVDGEGGLVSSASVVAAGWHDAYFRWDISTPQRVVSRLEQLPGQGSMSRGSQALRGARSVRKVATPARPGERAGQLDG